MSIDAQVSISPEQVFGRLRVVQPFRATYGSGKKVDWTCDCGRVTTSQIRYVLSGKTSSCGFCSLISAEKFAGMKFGKLRIVNSFETKPNSARRAEWACDCGRTTEAVVYAVTTGAIASCGICIKLDVISADEMSRRKFGKLRLKDPVDIQPGSSKKYTWICDCGNETILAPAQVCHDRDKPGTRGTKTCGRCKLVKASDIPERFGSLRIKDPVDLFPASQQKVVCICDCGKDKSIAINSLFSGISKTCGQCSEISAEEIAGMKFGFLKMKNPISIAPQSNKKVWWVCDCGQEKCVVMRCVYTGETRSCGNCFNIMTEWYKQNKETLKTLPFPIEPNQFPSGGMTPLENIINSYMPFRTTCFVCNGEYAPRLTDIRRGISLTCGCATNRISQDQQDIYNYIISSGREAVLEYKMGPYWYDVYVPSANLLIEYNGLKWHSFDSSKETDFKKYELAISKGHKYLVINSHEWKDKRRILDHIDNLIKDPIPAEQCSWKQLDSTNEYEIIHAGEIVAGCSFNGNAITNIQSCGYKINNDIWKQIFDSYLRKCGIEQLTITTDNRHPFELACLFDFQSETEQNFCYTRGSKTYDINDSCINIEPHKYKKMWDLGRKIWTYTLNSTNSAFGDNNV